MSRAVAMQIRKLQEQITAAEAVVNQCRQMDGAVGVLARKYYHEYMQEPKFPKV